MVTSEVDMVSEALVAFGVAAHAHVVVPPRPCSDVGLCVSEENHTLARIVDAATGGDVLVDAMTALKVVGALGSGGGMEQVWKELEAIDVNR